MLIAFLAAVLVAGAAAFWILRHPMFGKRPSGERLRRIQASPNYADGSFRNRVPKPHMVEGVSMPGLAWDFLFRKKERSRPTQPVPAQRTDIAALPADRDLVIWLGHSSLFMQVGGKRFLIDPNFTSYASPFTWRTYSFDGTDIYSSDEMPPIDYLLITHDHFDHLNYDTIVAIKNKVGRVYCGLGVGEHLEYWGVPAEKIVETDWNDTVALDGDMALHTLPTHHFSGRTLWKSNPSLWAAFVLETPAYRIYIGGDSGYDAHFAEAGARFGGFDLALLENGQYDANWRYNHMFPDEALKAAEDLRARRLLPVHAGRFVLANHPWGEPFKKIVGLAKDSSVDLVTPKIGEPLYLDEPGQAFSHWWEGVD